MTAARDDDVDSFRDGNSALFERRNDLRAELDAARIELGEHNRRVRRLRGRLDDVTAEIVRYNMGLVRSYTRRFSGASSVDDRAEFESAGLLGLMRAIDSYDPDSGVFGRWAFKPIQREVLRAVRDADHQHLSISDFESRPAILSAYRQLRGVDEAYHPSDEEVAVAAGVAVTQVRRVLAPPHVVSVNQSRADDSGELADTIADNELDVESTVITKMALAALEQFGLKALDSRELYVIVRRFGLDGEPIDKLADIGRSLDLSRESVRQIESKALAKLQHPIVLSHVNKIATRRASATI